MIRGVSRLRILHQDPDFVVVDKPAGFHVHPPEDESIRIPYGENALALLRDQLGRYVYPVHRIDRATSGLVIYALSGEIAGRFAALMNEGRIAKRYAAICRGWPRDDQFVEDSPMVNSLEGNGPEVPAETRVQVIARGEIDEPIGKFPRGRVSLVFAEPVTGRMHQIRRHLRRRNHPILGDSTHGDGAYNRWVRENFGKNVLFLRAVELSFPHPIGGEEIRVRASWGGPWMKFFDRLGVCPRI